MARPIIICDTCGEETEHQAFGLCRRCYDRKRYLKHNPSAGCARKPKIIICPECGEKRKHRALGLCEICYKRLASHRYYHKNKERQNAWMKRHYRDHKEEYRLRRQQWRQNNPGKVAAIQARRRARKSALPSTLTNEQVKQKMAIGYCFYCGQRFNLTLDHFVALGNETNQVCGTTLANTVIACGNCNSSKRDKLPENILDQLSFKEVFVHESL